MKYLLIAFSLFSFSTFVHAQSLKAMLKLSDEALFQAGLAGKVGKCYIGDSRKASHFCDYYAKTAKFGQSVGLPDAYGSGCLVAPSAPKRISVCWGAPNTYDQYNSSATPICTDDYIKNGANMLRIGIMKGLCNDNSSAISSSKQKTFFR